MELTADGLLQSQVPEAHIIFSLLPQKKLGYIPGSIGIGSLKEHLLGIQKAPGLILPVPVIDLVVGDGKNLRLRSWNRAATLNRQYWPRKTKCSCFFFFFAGIALF